ncbi:MerR family transcriptional regulator [Staphylococcus succinus]|uniref:MerR family transcriptional regulator n=1 Tax=Staphylococcus succinus TaxID=61015 RepID=UPI000E6A8581|nr:MerR family transcriptional regulator [Staphylococcus succinus]RIN24743.1 MerR family transcriptional regulator [Staphylococcus succinus]
MVNTNQPLDKDGLFTIGEMSTLFRTSIQTLRYYDKIGILTPEYIDNRTHYRYYSTNQFERLNTIKYLRALDISLKNISEFFNEKNVDTLLSILEYNHKYVLDRKQELDKIEKKVTNRINQLKSALSASYGEIDIKWFPKRYIMSLDRTFTSEDNLEVFIRELSRKYRLDDAIFLGKVGLSISKIDLQNFIFKRFSSVFLLIENEDNINESCTPLPEGLYATIHYLGTHEDSAVYYKKILAHLKKLNYQLNGDSLEITIIDDGITNNANKFVTEIQLPLK